MVEVMVASMELRREICNVGVPRMSFEGRRLDEIPGVPSLGPLPTDQC